MPETFSALAHHSLVGVAVTSLSLLGLLAVALSLKFRRAGKRRAEEEARRRAEMIRRRLQEEEKIVRRPVQIRVNP